MELALRGLRQKPGNTTYTCFPHLRRLHFEILLPHSCLHFLTLVCQALHSHDSLGIRRHRHHRYPIA